VLTNTISVVVVGIGGFSEFGEFGIYCIILSRVSVCPCRVRRTG